MSLLEIGSRNIGREHTYDDVDVLYGVILAAGEQLDSADFKIGTVLAVLCILDVANGRVAASEAARLYAKELLSAPLSFLPG